MSDSDDSLDLDQLDKELGTRSTSPGSTQTTLSSPPAEPRALTSPLKTSSAKPITITDTEGNTTTHELNWENIHTSIYPTNFPIRDYQYNIVQQALYKNVLCALPTGLGKTFIASTVILNWYRWTTSAKIIFMAPTRPLVSQQVEACLGITGIPRHDVSVLIGGTLSPKLRAQEWAEKRVFFATPQTVENDVKKGVVSPKDIVLMVIDEAHRATGRYAYNEVVEFVTKINSQVRLLSLTATPSGTVEGVQQILTNMKVSKAEIRTEESIDIRQHVHKRQIDKIQTEMLDCQKEILEFFTEALDPFVKDMQRKKVLFTDTPFMTSFAVLQSLQKYNASPASRDFRNPLVLRIRAVMKMLISLARALTLLKIHGVRQFYDKILAIQHDATVDKKTGKKKKPGKIMSELLENPSMKHAIERCEQVLLNKDGSYNKAFLGHAKLERLVEEMNEFATSQSSESRAIVFVEFRESAAEVCRAIAHNCTGIRPHLFIGQQGDSGEMINTGGDDYGEVAKKGMTQKEQQKVIKEFREGQYNVLVATSIGEEGLDIGQVDLIVCYDQSKSPIRGLQRMGRTGRKRQGRILMLLAENEQKKLDLAMGGYKYIQNQINGGKGTFEYAPVNRILPDDVKPQVLKQIIEIPEENKEVLKVGDGEKTVQLVEELQKRRSKGSTTSSSRSKNKGLANGKGSKLPQSRKVERKFFMPEGVKNTGFVKASSLEKEKDEFALTDEEEEIGSSKLKKRSGVEMDSDGGATGADYHEDEGENGNIVGSSSKRQKIVRGEQEKERHLKDMEDAEFVPSLDYKGHDPAMADARDSRSDTMISHSDHARRFLELNSEMKNREVVELDMSESSDLETDGDNTGTITGKARPIEDGEVVLIE